MTPLPKRRWSTHRQGKKRANFSALLLQKGKCPCSNCGELIKNHTACPKCGYYKGRAILKIKVKKTKASENQS